VTNEGVEILSKKPNITNLVIRGCTIDDEAMRFISEMKKLEVLDLHGCDKITNVSLKHILQCENLRKINVKGTGLTEEALVQLQEKKIEVKR
jgi:hypothetical protein